MLYVFVLSLVLKFVLGERSFTIDYENNCFLKDGKAFRYVSGSIHYYRVPHEYWRDRLRKLRYLGANAVQTYVEWSSHEPEPGQYSFEGDNDIIQFIKMAQEENLLVILRPGPFICAERDYGALPYWLKRQSPSMRLRTADPSFLQAVNSWYSVFLPKITPLLYSNGGPVIMVQLENEYGLYKYGKCDKQYMNSLRDMTLKHLKTPSVLFTTDPSNVAECGRIDGALPTADFGPSVDPMEAFKTLRKVLPKGPLVNSEYYSGWIDHWGEKHAEYDSKDVCRTLDKILAMNASVNIYLFSGGTNFGLKTGANADDNGRNYKPHTTGWDWDALLTEAGDPTQKLFDVRNVISKYLPVPDHIPKPEPSPKKSYGSVDMSCFIGDVFSFINEFSGTPVNSTVTKSFESLSQPNGFLLYSTQVTNHPSDPALLRIPGLKDRAHVFVNHRLQGILSRQVSSFELPISVKHGDELEIFVENQGRVNHGDAINEVKGIDGKVFLGKKVLRDWSHYRTSLHETEVIQKLSTRSCLNAPDKSWVPSFFKGTFNIEGNSSLADTFLSLKGWRKGVVWINGFNLGRYWPEVGPQQTLYVPGVRLLSKNEILILELESNPCFGSNIQTPCSVDFVTKHVINGPVPDT